MDYIVHKGFVVTSSCPWSSPCLLDTKSDGSPRFCTDFRKMNVVTGSDANPLPYLIDDCIDEIGHATYVNNLDMFFPVHCHAYGMCNVPATFQRLVNKELGPLRTMEYLTD